MDSAESALTTMLRPSAWSCATNTRAMPPRGKLAIDTVAIAESAGELVLKLGGHVASLVETRMYGPRKGGAMWTGVGAR